MIIRLNERRQLAWLALICLIHGIIQIMISFIKTDCGYYATWWLMGSGLVNIILPIGAMNIMMNLHDDNSWWFTLIKWALTWYVVGGFMLNFFYLGCVRQGSIPVIYSLFMWWGVFLNFLGLLFQ